jgi:hypothetical protein
MSAIVIVSILRGLEPDERKRARRLDARRGIAQCAAGALPDGAPKIVARRPDKEDKRARRDQS